VCEAFHGDRIAVVDRARNGFLKAAENRHA
jgi:hypothetical protein